MISQPKQSSLDAAIRERVPTIYVFRHVSPAQDSKSQE